MWVVYSIVNTINNRVYIGSSKNFKQRKTAHISTLRRRRHHNAKLQRFVDKYGIDTLLFEVLETFEEETACRAREEVLLNTMDNLFNLSKMACGGDLISYHPDRANIIAKVKESMRIRYLVKENRDASSRPGASNPNWKGGISFKKCIDCNKGIVYSAKRCSLCSKVGDRNPFYGKVHSQETREKIRSSHLGVKPSNSRPVVIDGVDYPSCTSAASAKGCCVATVLNRCNSSKFPTYFYKDSLETVKSH